MAKQVANARDGLPQIPAGCAVIVRPGEPIGAPSRPWYRMTRPSSWRRDFGPNRIGHAEPPSLCSDHASRQFQTSSSDMRSAAHAARSASSVGAMQQDR
jgi:hypothetical protein